jgi:hypothetical protein
LAAVIFPETAVKPGNPALARANRVVAASFAETQVVMLLALAGETTRAIAKALDDRGLKPPRGGACQAPQIMRLLARLELRTRKPRAWPSSSVM